MLTFRCISSGSSGNSYLITSDNCQLIIEAGVSFKQVLPYLEKNKQKFLIISHYHGDHAGYVNEYRQRGIPEFFGCLEKNDYFEMIPFSLIHDVTNYGYYIKIDNHYLAYITDTVDVGRLSFNRLDTIIIEASYDDEMIEQQAIDDKIEPFLYNRIINSHLSFSKSLKFVKKLDNFNKIETCIFIHLSESRSNERKLIDEARKVTSADIYVAKKNLLVNLKKI